MCLKVVRNQTFSLLPGFSQAVGFFANGSRVRFAYPGCVTVLVSHSYSVASGNHADEPLRRFIGLSLDEFGLDTFFVLSGYLATRSAIERLARDFFRSRFLRIFPAATTSSFLTFL